MLASLATIMKEKTALVTSMVYFALTKKEEEQPLLYQFFSSGKTNAVCEKQPASET